MKKIKELLCHRKSNPYERYDLLIEDGLIAFPRDFKVGDGMFIMVEKTLCNKSISIPSLMDMIREHYPKRLKD